MIVMSSSNPLFQGSGVYVQEEWERVQESELVDAAKETISSRPTRTDAYMNSHRLWQHSQNHQRFKADGLPALMAQTQIQSPTQ